MNLQNNSLEFTLSRLANYTGTAEGSTLTPKQQGDSRIPAVNAVRILRKISVEGGTAFTIGWEDPQSSRTFNVAGYNVYVRGINGNLELNGPFSAKSSPAEVTVPGNYNQPVTFFVQTQLFNGFVNSLEFCPSVSDLTLAAPLTPGYVLSTSLAQAANTSTGETNLYQYSLPAGTLQNNTGLTVTSAGTFSATANNKRIRVYLGATLLFDTGALAVTAALSWSLTLSVYRVSTTSGKLIATFSYGNTGPVTLTSYGTLAENFNDALNLRITGQGGATNDLYGQLFRVTYLS